MKKLFLIWQMESGSLAPEVLKEALETEPDQMWHTGDLVGSSQLRRKANGVRLEEEIVGESDTEACLEVFVEKHARNVARVLEGREDVSALLQVVVYSQNREGVFLKRDLMEVLTRVGSDFDFEAYVL